MQAIHLIEQPPVRTQFLIFTLFGDYVMDRGGKIWTSSLLRLMELLGVSERAVRSTLSRMTRKGWILPQKYGRLSQYTISARGRALLEGGQRRIFEPPVTDWDGQWHLVVYSLPEKKRRGRHTLRKQLTWLGFGHLAPGTWISPLNRRDELKPFFAELDVESYVDLFSGLYMGPASPQELIHRCWDLKGLEAQYQDFIARFEKEYLESRSLEANGRSLDMETCFIRRFWLTHEFQSFTLKDPNLPIRLLPAGWIGIRARRLLDDYRQLLGNYAHKFVDSVMGMDGDAG